MTRQALRIVMGAACALGGLAAGSEAGIFHRYRDGGGPTRRHPVPHTHERAGWPLCPAPWAEPSVTPSYNGYYVGGGVPYHGHSRTIDEGTWGWDYVGGHIPRRVWLGWSHGRREQGGTGSYRTDGAEHPWAGH